MSSQNQELDWLDHWMLLDSKKRQKLSLGSNQPNKGVQHNKIKDFNVSQHLIYLYFDLLYCPFFLCHSSNNL